MRSGFTLLELAIVLVVIGLLVGGIFAGQTLIRASAQRAAVREYTQFSTAVGIFRTKYDALPGDGAQTTAVFGKDSAVCPGNTGTALKPGTCNGNGDGVIDPALVASTSGEMFQFWKQLTLAGLIDGSFSGIAGPGGGLDSVAADNIPQSRFGGGAWAVSTSTGYAGDSVSYAFDYGNFFLFGAPISGNVPSGALLTGTEALGIDTKLDDGRPAKGKVIAFQWANCTTSASNTDYTGVYRSTGDTPACGLDFIQEF